MSKYVIGLDYGTDSCRAIIAGNIYRGEILSALETGEVL